MTGVFNNLFMPLTSEMLKNADKYDTEAQTGEAADEQRTL